MDECCRRPVCGRLVMGSPSPPLFRMADRVQGMKKELRLPWLRWRRWVEMAGLLPKREEEGERKWRGGAGVESLGR